MWGTGGLDPAILATGSSPDKGAHRAVEIMTRSLIIIGGGEHARVVGEAARVALGGWTVTGVVDPETAATAELLGVPRIADEAAFIAELASLPPSERPAVILAIGTTRARRALAELYDRSDARWATIVHPNAWVSPSARLGAGVVVMAAAVVNAGAIVGDHAIINTGAIVEHDVRIGAFAHVAPGAVIGGGASVGDESQIGLGARVRDHVEIGRDCVVGMGAVVIGPVADGVTVVGVPARPSRFTSR